MVGDALLVLVLLCIPPGVPTLIYSVWWYRLLSHREPHPSPGVGFSGAAVILGVTSAWTKVPLMLTVAMAAEYGSISGNRPASAEGTLDNTALVAAQMGPAFLMVAVLAVLAEIHRRRSPAIDEPHARFVTRVRRWLGSGLVITLGLVFGLGLVADANARWLFEDGQSLTSANHPGGAFWLIFLASCAADLAIAVGGLTVGNLAHHLAIAAAERRMRAAFGG